MIENSVARQTHLSVHIEKTAGSSIIKYLFDFYGRKNVMVYSAQTESLFPADNIVMLLRFSPKMDKFRTSKIGKALSPLIHHSAMGVLRTQGGLADSGTKLVLPEHVAAIHGHFQADKFDGLICDPFKTVIFRDPLQRVASHYRYWRMSKGVLNERVYIPYDPKMSFQDFALSLPMQNYQTKALGANPIECFDVVGVAEGLESFISEFARKREGYGHPVSTKLMRLNASTEYSAKTHGADACFEKTFKSLNELDYMNWAKAKEITGYTS